MHDALLLGDVVHRSHALSDHAALVLCAAVHKNATLQGKQGERGQMCTLKVIDCMASSMDSLVSMRSQSRKLYLSYGCLRLSLHFRGAL